MKKKNILFTIILVAVLFIPSIVSAAQYYETDDGTYMLCGGNFPTCVEVKRGQNGVQFNLSEQEIIYEGVSYYYDEEYQEEYNNQQQGSTRMYYYIDRSDRYVLCETSSSCKTYTFDRLTSMGATINNPISITLRSEDGPGVSGDVYYFSQEQQDAYNTENNITGDGTNDGTDGSGTLVYNDECTRLKAPLKFIGHIVLVAKIAIPILIIIFGMLDFFKAVTGSKDDEIKKSGKSLAMRCVAGVIIFLLPTLVSVVFSLIDSWTNIEGDFDACQKCVLNVSQCK